MDIKFLNAAERDKLIPLEWPIEADGVEYRAIRLKRLTAAEVVEFHKTLADLPADAAVTFPIYVAEDGSALPDGLLDALDADDRDALNEAALGFLPRRFRGSPSAVSAPPAGVPTV